MNQLEKLQLLKKLYEEKKYKKMVQTAFSADGAYADRNDWTHEEGTTVWGLVGKRTIGDTDVTDWHFEEAAQYLYLKAIEDEKSEIEFHKLTD